MKYDALSKDVLHACPQHEPKLLIPLVSKLPFHETEKAVTNLLLLYTYLDNDVILQKIITAAIGTADPDLALNNLERLSSIAPRNDFFSVLKSEHLTDLLTILGASPFLATILYSQPSLLASLFAGELLLRQKTETEMLQELSLRISTSATFATLQKELRLFKKREILRIATRDLCRKATFMDIAAELSALAGATLQKAYEICNQLQHKEYGAPRAQDSDVHSDAEFIILGMGKLGGYELNFSSDIDLMFFYSSSDGTTEGIKDALGKPKNSISLPVYFNKLGSLISKAVNQPTEDGFVFRVDLGLRPGGSSGEIAHSCAYAEQYYEYWGHSWERAALLKARPVAGSKKLGDRLLKKLEPFIYRKYLDYGMVEDLKIMKQKIDNNLKRKREGEQNIKLGRGGIREIEFFIQALQLIHSGKNPALRDKNSLHALANLYLGKILSQKDYQDLKEAYIFLRCVENHIQVFQEKQTHNLPEQPEALTALSRRCGFPNVIAFRNELEKHRLSVGNIYRTLFYSSEEELDQAASGEAIFLLNPTADSEMVQDILEEKGFQSPSGAYESLLVLRDGPQHVQMTQKARRLLHRIAPVFVQDILESAEPERALNYTEQFFISLRSRTPVFALLAENHHLIHLLVSLFSTSQFLSHFFIKDPSILDSLASSAYTDLFKSREEMEEDLNRSIDTAVYYEDKLDNLRHFRHEEFLRISLNDIQNKALQEDVTAQFSCLADVCLNKAVEIAREALISRFGIPVCRDNDGTEHETAFAIVALGKLGGRELNYHSDLDIIFIYENEGKTRPHPKTSIEKFKPQTNQEYFSRLAQRIISVLTLRTSLGHVFQIDTRLRPSGNQGPLVTSLAAFEKYHQASAQVWERQALAKARVVSGPKNLRHAIEKEIDQIVFHKPLPHHFAEELCRLRKRMEKEVAREGDGRLNIKMGRGGMVDVEFLTQYLQILHGKDHPEIKCPNTLHALQAIGNTGFLSQEDLSTFVKGYKFLHKLENKLRLIHDQSINEISGKKDYLARLAKRLGYPDTPQPSEQLFLKDYQEITERVREAFTRLLCPPGQE